jgi:hypothetical protein
MDIIVVPLTLGPGSVRRYSEKDWDVLRPVITNLYRVRKKTLYEVRAVLWQQHDFRVR